MTADNDLTEGLFPFPVRETSGDTWGELDTRARVDWTRGLEPRLAIRGLLRPANMGLRELGLLT